MAPSLTSPITTKQYSRLSLGISQYCNIIFAIEVGELRHETQVALRSHGIVAVASGYKALRHASRIVGLAYVHALDT
jgi:hypothetical protein